MILCVAGLELSRADSPLVTVFIARMAQRHVRTPPAPTVASASFCLASAPVPQFPLTLVKCLYIFLNRLVRLRSHTQGMPGGLPKSEITFGAALREGGWDGMSAVIGKVCSSLA